MNFQELQIIWDSQKNEPIFKIDKNALTRIVTRQSIAIYQDLKVLEVCAIFVLVILGCITLIDTFFNGKEYFQIVSVVFEFSAASFLWQRRKQRELQIPKEPLNLIEKIELSTSQILSTIKRGRDMAVIFSIFAAYEVAIRIWIYGWQGSEIKTLAAIILIAMLAAILKFNESKVHRPRLKNLQALREKLLDINAS